VTGADRGDEGANGGGGVSHTAKQTAPIQLGTSGGSVTDLANGFCCSGTLGSLVQKGRQSVHPEQQPRVSRAMSCRAATARCRRSVTDVTQPGYVDNNCSTANTNLVADVSTLSTTFPRRTRPRTSTSPLPRCARAWCATDGAILEIGTLSAQTVAAFVGAGRSRRAVARPALTRASISGLNATVTVGYEQECGGASYTKTYTGQLVINQHHSGFLNSGDSGSLMVEDIATNPARGGACLFAGSSNAAIANPIADDPQLPRRHDGGAVAP